jgi:hypothetical protein
MWSSAHHDHRGVADNLDRIKPNAPCGNRLGNTGHWLPQPSTRCAGQQK